jgi:hypothetical protein
VRVGSRDQQFQLRLLHPSAVHGGRVGQWRSVRTQFTCGVWGPAAAPPLAINLRCFGRLQGVDGHRLPKNTTHRSAYCFRVAVRHNSPLSCPPPLRVFNVQRIYPSGTFAQWRKSSSLSSSSPAFPSSRSGPSRRRKNEADKKIARQGGLQV